MKIYTHEIEFYGDHRKKHLTDKEYKNFIKGMEENKRFVMVGDDMCNVTSISRWRKIRPYGIKSGQLVYFSDGDQDANY